jgi:hypothetical protein
MVDSRSENEVDSDLDLKWKDLISNIFAGETNQLA